MADSELPKYVVEIADFLNWKAVITMRFPHVGMRFYPLRADFAKLQSLCDKWLNFTAEEDDRPPFKFKPAAPFVMLQTVNYDRLEVSDDDAEPTRDNLGWLKQHEAIFAVPLEWYRWEKDKWVFVDWAMTYPFLYLDHPISLWMGREMYGWPKIPIRVPRLFPLVNPPDPRGRVSFQFGGPRPGTPGDARRNPNLSQPYTPFIEINQAPNAFYPMASLADCWRRGPEKIAGALSAYSGIVNLAASAGMPRRLLGVRGKARRGLEYAIRWLPQMVKMYAGGGASEGHKFTPSPFMKNNITLKQFRDVKDVDSVCYQALVKSELAVERVWGGGYLFNPMLGDLSGGVTIRLHDCQDKDQRIFEGRTIIETLGLRDAEIIAAHGDRQDGKVHELKPFFPFWWDLDLTYDKAENLAWRAKNTRWSVTSAPGAERKPRKDYVILGSSATVELAGPRDYKRSRMLVMPVPANLKRLKRLCEDYLDNDRYWFNPTSDHVLVVADQFRDMSATTARPASWADSELAFVVVGEYFDKSRQPQVPAPQTKGAPIVMPMIGFVGSEWNAISDREVFGRFSLASQFVPAEAPLLGTPLEDGYQTLFHLRTSFNRAADEDDQVRWRTLLELAERWERRSAFNGSVEPLALGSLIDLNEPKLEDPMRTLLARLGLASVVNNRRPDENPGFDMVGLKQFRDASEADRACYQALVKTRRAFDGTPKVNLLKNRIRLTIREFDTIKLVESFGLQGGSQSGPKYTFDVENPFVVTGGFDQTGGENLCWRASTMKWRDDSKRD